MLERLGIGVKLLRQYLGVINPFSGGWLTALFGLIDAVDGVGIHGVSLPIRMVGVDVTLQRQFLIPCIEIAAGTQGPGRKGEDYVGTPIDHMNILSARLPLELSPEVSRVEQHRNVLERGDWGDDVSPCMGASDMKYV